MRYKQKHNHKYKVCSFKRKQFGIKNIDMEKTNLMMFYETCSTKYRFATKVARRAGMSLNGVINWCKGYSKTNDEFKLQILSEETGIPKEKLFTTEEEYA